MKKWIACLTALVMALSAAAAFGEAAPAKSEVLEQLNGKQFIFSSGVGAWYTSLTMGEDGPFVGEYHDSDMGDTGEGYPDGTVYGCLFHGRFEETEQIDEYSWKLKVAELALDDGQVPEAIEDGIRYITSDPYGLQEAKEMVLYLPGTPVDKLPEDFMPWSHLPETDPEAKVTPFFSLWNETDQTGFISE